MASRAWSAVRTVEAPLVGDVVDQQYAHGAPIVGRGNGAEALLAGRVPYLQLHALAVELDGPDLEVDADGGDEGGGKRVFAEPQQTARFAYARVANEEQFDLGVPSVGGLRCRRCAAGRASAGEAYEKVVVSCARHGGGVPSRGRGLRCVVRCKKSVGGDARGRRCERESSLLSGASGRVEASARRIRITIRSAVTKR